MYHYQPSASTEASAFRVQRFAMLRAARCSRGQSQVDHRLPSRDQRLHFAPNPMKHSLSVSLSLSLQKQYVMTHSHRAFITRQNIFDSSSSARVMSPPRVHCNIESSLERLYMDTKQSAC